jgi:hypothetical protein
MLILVALIPDASRCPTPRWPRSRCSGPGRVSPVIQDRSAGRAPTRNMAPDVVALVLVCPPPVLASLPGAFYGMAKSL